MKDFDGSVSTTDSNVLLKKEKIKLRSDHFCLWAFLGKCTMKVQIRPYIQNNLRKTKTVTLKVFAIKKCDVKVSILCYLYCVSVTLSNGPLLDAFETLFEFPIKAWLLQNFASCCYVNYNNIILQN